MHRIELTPGTEQLFRSSKALVDAIRSGEVASQARVFHSATAKWVSVTLHPLYKRHVQSRREARLRPEFAHLYPYLQAGQWECAAELTHRVVGSTLGRPDGLFIKGERALDEKHFMFRGSDERQAPRLDLRREDP